jgi:hypothetical protein
MRRAARQLIMPIGVERHNGLRGAARRRASARLQQKLPQLRQLRSPLA